MTSFKNGNLEVPSQNFVQCRAWKRFFLHLVKACIPTAISVQRRNQNCLARQCRGSILWSRKIIKHGLITFIFGFGKQVVDMEMASPTHDPKKVIAFSCPGRLLFVS